MESTPPHFLRLSGEKKEPSVETQSSMWSQHLRAKPSYLFTKRYSNRSNSTIWCKHLQSQEAETLELERKASHRNFFMKKHHQVVKSWSTKNGIKFSKLFTILSVSEKSFYECLMTTCAPWKIVELSGYKYFRVWKSLGLFIEEVVSLVVSIGRIDTDVDSSYIWSSTQTIQRSMWKIT